MGWVCRVEVLLKDPTGWVYRVTDCDTGTPGIVADSPNLGLGDCSNPDINGCYPDGALAIESGEGSFFAVSPNLRSAQVKPEGGSDIGSG